MAQAMGVLNAEFILSEANGSLSRDNGVLAAGNNLPAGAVLGQLENGQFTAFDPDAETGAETAVALLIATTDATHAPAPIAVVRRLAEVVGHRLHWGAAAPEDVTAGLTSLATSFLLAR